ncbi:hypothetical protein BOX15_Mlig008770g3 [Macrostomum lignano]|uniref:Uncharacterized protein n=1 Tax=Macrostomum lignano TaxID=282301 RepID=A0A267H3M6_9PLAT|nr:hypothetical protein BOX15_Mlig008770g3 [Macrostomum lignano]
MYIASQEGHVEIVQGTGPSHGGHRSGHAERQHSFVRCGTKWTQVGGAELIKAKAAVQPETAHLCTPLYGASFLGDRSIVDSLLKLGANPNLDCGISVIQPALHVAVHCNQLPIVLSLIKAQVEVNQIGELGTTALYTAAQENHWKIARALVEANADADATLHPEGAAPIHIASQLGHHRIVQLLAKVALADVNLRLSSGRTALHLASQAGHAASVKILLSVPQIDMNLTDSTGCSALLAASREGHTNTVDLLLAAGAVPELKAHDGITPMLISALNGHRKVLDRLTSYRSTMKLSVDNYFPASTASEQSLLVHQSMLRAGFTRSRAALQTAAAEVLHQLVPARSRCDKENKIFVMGSFAEGWGSCMASLNGDIDPDSDIDYLMIDTNQLFHLKNYCRCRHPDPASVRKTVEYCNGEITCDDFASNCSTKHVETGNKSLGPAIHLETALSLCCYPPMAVLQPQNDSNMSQRVLDLLRQEITSTPCHLVRAASPGSAGSQFRVSTAFLERKLMQNLTTLQGQLFVIIKYLFKRVISNCVPGLKTYHAKTLLFRMLEATPADQWRPENLFSLTRHALQMMLNYVEQSCNLKTFDGQIMRHFFLSDAALYLQGQSRDTAMKIAQCLIELIHQLPYILAEFNDGLASIPDSENFSFHPFLLLLTLEEKPKPLIEASIEKFALEIQYLSIYDNVKEALVMLDEDDTSSDCRSVLDDVIARLPDCASKSRETLRALSCIKFGRLEAASEVLLSSRQPEVHRGISWKEELSQFEPTKELVWQHLRSHDSAWKFHLKFDSPIKFNFLSVNNIFSTCLLISGNEIYVNFEALHRSLSVALCRS